MYETLFKHYDAFMRDVDYDNWVDFVAGFLAGKTDGIDFACGTGKFTIGLARKGFCVTGVDLSAQMLSTARDNAQAQGRRVTFLQGDFCLFRPQKPVSFITVMCDGINYTKNPLTALKNMYACLASKGILIFDISSEYKLKTLLGNSVFSDESETGVYIWKNRLCKSPPRVEMDLTFFEKEGSHYLKKTEMQTQYIYTEAEIMSALKAAGFCNMKIFAETGCKKPQGATQRIHFIAEKP